MPDQHMKPGDPGYQKYIDDLADQWIDFVDSTYFLSSPGDAMAGYLIEQPDQVIYDVSTSYMKKRKAKDPKYASGFGKDVTTKESGFSHLTLPWNDSEHTLLKAKIADLSIP